MVDDPRQEYIEALANFKAAQARLIEAKKHVPPSSRERRPPSPEEERKALHEWNAGRIRRDIITPLARSDDVG